MVRNLYSYNLFCDYILFYLKGDVNTQNNSRATDKYIMYLNMRLDLECGVLSLRQESSDQSSFRLFLYFKS